MSGKVHGRAGYRGDYWTSIGTSNRLFCYSQTENSVILSSEQVNYVDSVVLE
jgi:hypothetical protein